MGTTSLTDLLTAWREAERRWERPGPPDEVRARALEVVTAWVAYQDAAMPPDTDEVWLVADDEQVYIGVTGGVTRLLGYEVAELIGQRVQDVAAPELQAATAAQWLDFLAAGRQDGVFRFRSKDGRHISLRYQARAHHPVPGFHMSRLRPDDRSSQRSGIAEDRASA